ncbi:MAG: hypothetical protein WBV82_29765 [Myxococcaceae bacterium]
MTRRSAIRRRRSERGQAMLEYSILNWVLVVGLLLGSAARIIPGPPETGGLPQNVIEMFLAAYQVYYDSFYFVLNSPFP